MPHQALLTAVAPADVNPCQANVRIPRWSAGATYLIAALQVAGMLAAASAWSIEGSAFQALLIWTGMGFAVHYWLPRRLQMPFFVVLSLGATGVALGATRSGWHATAAVQQAGLVLSIGVGLIAICHLPWSPPRRWAALVAAGVALAFARANYVELGLGPLLWSMLGSMFMFRMVIYAHAVARERVRPALSHSLAYFFMLPNVYCPLFPVVDWRSFERGYFNDEPIRIYEKGLRWMLRGLLQLVLYRVIDQQLYIAPPDVANGADLARFFVANYALYLRVSGLFHWIVGTLHLFGWNLPETNHQYFLADSFTDYWRRVNIYWKEFMLNIFFNPVALHMRGAGTTWAVVIGSAVAFAATWALHAYQVFWLTGELHSSPQDALFWGILGVLVMINAGREAKRGSRKTLSKVFNWRRAAAAAVRTSGVYGVLCILWSLWSAESLREWLELWRHADTEFATLAGLVLFFVAACKLCAEGAEGWRVRAQGGRRARERRTLRVGSVLGTCAVSLALVVLGEVQLSPDAIPEGFARALVSSAQSRSLASRQHVSRGYYESLLDAPRVDTGDNGLGAGHD